MKHQIAPAHPLELLQTKEMAQVMNVLAEFSEKEKDFFALRAATI